MIVMLQKKQDATEDMETQFLLSDQVYMKALIAPTNKVCLWLGVSFVLPLQTNCLLLRFS